MGAPPFSFLIQMAENIVCMPDKSVDRFPDVAGNSGGGDPVSADDRQGKGGKCENATRIKNDTTLLNEVYG